MTTPEFPIDVLVLPDQVSDPASASGSTKAYGKAVGGVTQRHGMSGAGVVGQMTPPTYGAGSLTYANRASYFTFGNGSQLAQSTSLQNVFPSGAASISSLPVGSYQMRGQYGFTASVGVTNTAWSLAFSGTATYSSFRYFQHSVYSNSVANAFNNVAYEGAFVATNASTVVRAANGFTSLFVFIDGFFTVSVAGSFTPQVSFTPVSASFPHTVQSLSFLEVIPLTASFVSQGAWGS